jgi:hypothetical protein
MLWSNLRLTRLTAIRPKRLGEISADFGKTPNRYFIPAVPGDASAIEISLCGHAHESARAAPHHQLRRAHGAA